MLQLRVDGVRLCPECWPQHSLLPLRFTPRTLWGLLWRPRATLNGMRRTGAGVVDVPWVLIVGDGGDLAAFMIGIVSRAIAESFSERVGRPTALPALIQIATDLWAWSAFWPPITVLASLTLVPWLDSRLLRALGEKVSFPEAVRCPMAKRLAASLKAQRHRVREEVLHRPEGGQATRATVHKWLMRAEKKAGLPPLGALHTLRHTFCSRLARQGAPAAAIQQLAGHSTYSTTARYVHLFEGAKESAIRLLEGEEFGDILETSVSKPAP